jgi:serine/threonine protein phosphatase PrpC
VVTSPVAAGCLTDGIRLVGASVRGAGHVRSGQPNQDALHWEPARSESGPVVMAVADGHGSARSARSDRGAALAVLVAVSTLRGRLSSQSPRDVSRSSAASLASAAKEIASSWHEAVLADYEEDPLAESERSRLMEAGADALGEVLRNPVVAYGATLLAVAVTELAIHILQIGDGEVLAVYGPGDVRRPLVGDERLLGNVTTSLSAAEAWRDFRVGTINATEAPRLIVLCTDGYSNSFETEDAFLQAGEDLLRMADSEGLDRIAEHLEGWLHETSELGAGDDVTLGLVSIPSGRWPQLGQVPPKASTDGGRRDGWLRHGWARGPRPRGQIALAGLGLLLVGFALGVWSGRSLGGTETVPGAWFVQGEATVLRVDETPPASVQVPTTSGIVDAAGVGDRVWVLHREGRVTIVEPASGSVEAQIEMLPGRPTAMTAGAGFVWLIDEQAGRVLRIDPSDLSMVTIPLDEAGE